MLKYQQVQQEPTCQICKTGVEDVFHALMECKVATKVWKYNYGDSELQGMVREDILSLILSLLR